MSRFIVHGGKPLRGAVRLGGAKNASFKLMIAAALGTKESRLLNLSDIGDVRITTLTLQKLGIEVNKCGDMTYFIKPAVPNSSEIPQIAGEKSRASTLFAALLLARTGKASIPRPGGCSLGPRPIERHLEGFIALGAQVTEDEKLIHFTAPKLVGATYKFKKKSHTGTEAMILAAVLAEGRTVIENAGLEPEIDDLILFLNNMGAKVRRAPLDKIVIDGVVELGGAIHQVVVDRNEAVSYAVAALATKGDIVIENAREDHLHYFLEKVAEIGGRFDVASYGIRVWYEKPLVATDIITKPEPGFMTDWQPMWTVLMTQCIGESQVIEAVHNDRLQFTSQLNKMGANISLYQPEVKNPDEFYEFDIIPGWDKPMHAAKIVGATTLMPNEHLVVPDLRGGATLTIAALVANGTSIIEGTDQIERGYEKIHERLTSLGANIERIED